MKDHFEVILVDGQHLDFQGQCSNVDYGNEQVCIFKRSLDAKKYQVLAIIPYSRILYIIRVEGKSQEQEEVIDE